MGGGSSKSQTIGYRYYMSLHMGLGRGPIDEIVQIHIGGLRAWPVAQNDMSSVSAETKNQINHHISTAVNPPRAKLSALMTVGRGPDGFGIAQFDTGEAITLHSDHINTTSGPSETQINAGNLFGGDKKEGGISGNLKVLMGAPAQDKRGWFAEKGMPGPLPAFRGFASLLFDGLICSINPYPKKWSFRVRRTWAGWDGPVWQLALATIWLKGGSIKAMNPAHIIYECLTNRDWGRGFDRSAIDEASFRKSAQTLFDEGFGLCLKWSRESELSEFIVNVIDHIGASLYNTRETGKIGLKLLRGDYDVADIPLFTYNTGLLAVEQQTNSQNDLVNEVVIEWFDPMLNMTRQSRIHNLASIQSMGAKNSVKRSYTGLSTEKLAMRVAQRDLKAGATSLKRYSVTLDRRAWRIIPGDVFRISAPDLGINDVILRAGKITENSGTDGRIKVEAVLDVFGMPNNTFVLSEESTWVAPDRTPAPVDDFLIREATYGDLVQTIDPANLKEVASNVGFMSLLVKRPNPMVQGFSIATAAMGETLTNRASGNFIPTFALEEAVNLSDTFVTFTEGSELGGVKIGSLVQIGNEICRLDNIVSTTGYNGTLTIARGCVDTIPQSHPIGEIAYIYDSSLLASDNREYIEGEIVDIKILPTTSIAELPMESAPTQLLPITARQSRPWLPGRLLINGTPYRAFSGNFTGDLTVAWSSRDRLLIQDQLISHDESAVGNPLNVTYRLQFYKSGALISTIDNIDTNSFVYSSAAMTSDGLTGSFMMKLTSVEFGRVSFMSYEVNLTRG